MAFIHGSYALLTSPEAEGAQLLHDRSCVGCGNHGHCHLTRQRPDCTMVRRFGIFPCPLLFATEAGLGVHAASEYLFLVIGCVADPVPVTTPLKVWLCEDEVSA
jgi:hypothetical protein